MLESLINLINKRPHIENEFKKIDGYVLLQHIYTSIATLNKFSLRSIQKNQTNSSRINYNHYYYALIQKKLFVVLINGSFRKPVFCMNFYTDENIEMCYNFKRTFKTDLNSTNELAKNNKSSNIYIINADLLAQVIIEWTLWRPFETISSYSTPSSPSQSPHSFYNTQTNLWKHIFQILNKILDDDHLSQLYHSNLFLKYNLLEKLIHFLLDANEENCVFDESSCVSLINIFKHFNSIRSQASVTKQLFSNFFDYLHILHPENNAYIVYSSKLFYYNLNINLAVNLQNTRQSSLTEKSSKAGSKEDLKRQISEESDSTNKSISETASNELEQQSQLRKNSKSLAPSLKRQLINLDRFQSTENENNFSLISAGLIDIMHDMILILPDIMVNEILNLLKFESFIMFAMVSVF